jgi:hypothetical protein
VFIAPRPMVDDDPLFPVRAAIMPVIGFAVGMALQSPLAAMYPTLMFGLLVSNRKAFDLVKVIAGPAVFVTVLWLMSLVVLGLQGIPVTLFIVLAVFYFVAFYLIQRTGNALGMLIIIALLMMTSRKKSGSLRSATCLAMPADTPGQPRPEMAVVPSSARNYVGYTNRTLR